MRQVPMTKGLVRLSLGARADGLEIAAKVIRGSVSLKNLRLSEVSQVLAAIEQTLDMLGRFSNPELAKKVELLLQEFGR